MAVHPLVGRFFQNEMTPTGAQAFATVAVRPPVGQFVAVVVRPPVCDGGGATSPCLVRGPFRLKPFWLKLFWLKPFWLKLKMLGFCGCVER